MSSFLPSLTPVIVGETGYRLRGPSQHPFSLPLPQGLECSTSAGSPTHSCIPPLGAGRGDRWRRDSQRRTGKCALWGWGGPPPGCTGLSHTAPTSPTVTRGALLSLSWRAPHFHGPQQGSAAFC